MQDQPTVANICVLCKISCKTACKIHCIQSFLQANTCDMQDHAGTYLILQVTFAWLASSPLCFSYIHNNYVVVCVELCVVCICMHTQIIRHNIHFSTRV